MKAYEIISSDKVQSSVISSMSDTDLNELNEARIMFNAQMGHDAIKNKNFYHNSKLILEEIEIRSTENP